MWNSEWEHVTNMFICACVNHFLYSMWTSADMAVRIICGKSEIWSVLEEIMYRSGRLNCKIINMKFFLASSRKSSNFAGSSHRTFCNMICFYGEELLAPRPIPKLEDHPLSAVHDCIFNIFTATPILEAVPPSATWRHAIGWGCLRIWCWEYLDLGGMT